jgi:hypothetical protein
MYLVDILFSSGVGLDMLEELYLEDLAVRELVLT